MVKIRQAIVVEGKYDQNTLSQLVDATIFQTHGFGVMHDKALLSLLRRAAQTTGLIIFTDSDGAGFVIRNRACCTPTSQTFPARKSASAHPEKKGCSAWRA